MYPWFITTFWSRAIGSLFSRHLCPLLAHICQSSASISSWAGESASLLIAGQTRLWFAPLTDPVIHNRLSLAPKWCLSLHLKLQHRGILSTTFELICSLSQSWLLPWIFRWPRPAWGFLSCWFAGEAPGPQWGCGRSHGSGKCQSFLRAPPSLAPVTASALAEAHGSMVDK